MRINHSINSCFKRKKTNFFKQFNWKINSLVIIFVSGLFLYATNSFAQADGEKLFKQACGSCHSITNDKIVGPGLKGILEKRKEEWLLKWIKGSTALIKSGDADAKAVFDKYNGLVMPDQNFKDDEIKAILAYATAGPVKVVAAANDSTAIAVSGSGGSAKNEINSTWVWLISIFLVVVFLMFLLLYRLNKTLQAIGHKGIPLMTTRFTILVIDYINKHKKVVGITFLIIILFGVKSCWDGLIGIGVSQGYEPTQPIQYSHKIHAGQNGIACQYCHSGAYKSKTAGVPSANVCMNCHKYIQSGTVTGKEEIAKIYKALDYNPETQEYGKNPKPIEWVRVHNLPDLTYFNHSQHVVAGKVECQTCHGQVQDMDVVKQFAPLTMRWCVDCHKATEVKMDTNPYYEEIHKKFKEKYKGQKITVDKIGGLDCAKCHY